MHPYTCMYMYIEGSSPAQGSSFFMSTSLCFALSCYMYTLTVCVWGYSIMHVAVLHVYTYNYA